MTARLDIRDIQALAQAIAGALGPAFQKALENTILKANADAQNFGSILAIPAGGVPTLVFDYNPRRLTATAVNSGNDDCTVSLDNAAAALGAGAFLKARGGSIVLGRGTDIKYTGRLYAFSTYGTTIVCTEINME